MLTESFEIESFTKLSRDAWDDAFIHFMTALTFMHRDCRKLH